MSGKIVGWAFKQNTGSSTAKLVLVKLAEHSDMNGLTYPSIKLMVRETELAQSTVYNCLRKLEALTLIERFVYKKRIPESGACIEIIAYRMNLPASITTSAERKQIPQNGIGIPPRGKIGLGSGNANSEPPMKSSLEAAAFVAPAIAARTERLISEIGQSKFDVWFAGAVFLDETPPRISLNGTFKLNWVRDKLRPAVERVFGEDCVFDCLEDGVTDANHHLRKISSER